MESSIVDRTCAILSTNCTDLTWQGKIEIRKLFLSVMRVIRLRNHSFWLVCSEINDCWVSFNWLSWTKNNGLEFNRSASNYGVFYICGLNWDAAFQNHKNSVPRSFIRFPCSTLTQMLRSSLKLQTPLRFRSGLHTRRRPCRVRTRAYTAKKWATIDAGSAWNRLDGIRKPTVMRMFKPWRKCTPKTGTTSQLRPSPESSIRAFIPMTWR